MRSGSSTPIASRQRGPGCSPDPTWSRPLSCSGCSGTRAGLQMLCALLEAGELCVCDLAAVVEMTESSVSHSLRLLRTAGIVRQRRSGRQVFYALDDAHVRLLLDVSIEHVGHGAVVMSEKLVLDLPVLLPDALDGRDQCVDRLTATLTGVARAGTGPRRRGR